MTDFKIFGGTTVGNKSLCDSCMNATVVEGHSVSQKLTFCGTLYGRGLPMPFPVAKCSEYWQRGTLIVKLDSTYLASEVQKVDPNNAGKNIKAGFGKE